MKKKREKKKKKEKSHSFSAARHTAALLLPLLLLLLLNISTTTTTTKTLITESMLFPVQCNKNKQTLTYIPDSASLAAPTATTIFEHNNRTHTRVTSAVFLRLNLSFPLYSLKIAPTQPVGSPITANADRQQQQHRSTQL